MKKSRKEFIKKAHSHACSEWKQKIENEFSKLFKNEINVGIWYKDHYGNLFFGMKKLNSQYYMCYGFERDGTWIYNSERCLGDLGRFKPATDKEVKTALIKEAKKRGFKKGVRYISIDYCKGEVLEALSGLYESFTPHFRTNSSTPYRAIFEDGKWATIINTITKEEAEKQLGKTIID